VLRGQHGTRRLFARLVIQDRALRPIRQACASISITNQKSASVCDCTVGLPGAGRSAPSDVIFRFRCSAFRLTLIQNVEHLGYPLPAPWSVIEV
jgi:hypothetical protein